MTTEERLEKLEQELSAAKRRARWLLAGVAVCLGVGLAAWAFRPQAATAQPAPGNLNDIRARRIILEDDNGKPRLVLGAKEGAGLALTDENGKPRAMLFMTKDGVRLSLSDENNQERAALAVTKDGPGLALYDQNGKTRATLAFAIKTGAGLVLVDESGKVVWGAP